jgi:hypothetical protein
MGIECVLIFLIVIELTSHYHIVMLNVIMLLVAMLNVIMLIAAMQNVVMRSVLVINVECHAAKYHNYGCCGAEKRLTKLGPRWC